MLSLPSDSEESIKAAVVNVNKLVIDRFWSSISAALFRRLVVEQFIGVVDLNELKS